MTIRTPLYISLMLMLPLLAAADTVTIVQGTAGDANFLPATAPSPNLGGVINFANLAGGVTSNCVDNLVCPTFNPDQYAAQGVTISSPDGLLIFPFSTQTSGGIELYDPGATDSSTCAPNFACDGTANITIGIAGGVSELAVGISDGDDPLALTITALGAGGTVLASMDVSSAVEAADSAENYANTYFVAEDATGAGIYGLQITQTVPTFGSGLALAEVEVTPEPSTLLLLSAGAAIFGALRLRKRA